MTPVTLRKESSMEWFMICLGIYLAGIGIKKILTKNNDK